MTPPEAIVKLAESLGTSVERLWPLLVQRVRMEGAVTLFLCLATPAVYFTVVRSWVRRIENQTDDFIVQLYCVIGIILSVASVTGASRSILALLNPEAAAVMKVLEALK